MSATHTPGPWTVYKDGLDIRHHGWMIAELSTHGPERLANARLIAAAPDLLEAAERISAHAELGYCLNADLDALRAAIAKAKGQQ